MEEEVKEEITILLDLLKKSLIKNHVSMATDSKGNIHFFDTDTYVETKKMNGFYVNVQNMVKWLKSKNLKIDIYISKIEQVSLRSIKHINGKMQDDTKNSKKRTRSCIFRK